MFFKPNVLHAAAVLALTVAGSAHATLDLTGTTSSGNSSVTFVAIDLAGTISFTADLGTQMADFLPFVSGQTFAAGGLSAPGTTAIFNLRNNTYTLNGVTQSGTNSWNASLSNFLSNSSVTGGSYQWGIVGGDGVLGAPSATNPARGQNIVFSSGTAVDYNNSNADGINPAAVANAVGQINEFYAGSNTATGNTHTPGTNGSNTATAGTAFLGQSMVNGGVGNFSQQFGNNNYLQDPGALSYFSWVSVNGPATTATLGATLGVGVDPARPATWAWNEATGNLTYTVPVPEASTYAMFAAGLAAMGLVVRRRTKR